MRAEELITKLQTIVYVQNKNPTVFMNICGDLGTITEVKFDEDEDIQLIR